MIHTFTKILVKGVAGYKDLGTGAYLSGIGYCANQSTKIRGGNGTGQNTPVI